MVENNLEERWTDERGITYIIQFNCYDSNGERVRVCPNCERKKSLNEFGWRTMANGEIRNQSWCSACR